MQAGSQKNAHLMHHKDCAPAERDCVALSRFADERKCRRRSHGAYGKRFARRLYYCLARASEGALAGKLAHARRQSVLKFTVFEWDIQGIARGQEARRTR